MDEVLRDLAVPGPGGLQSIVDLIFHNARRKGPIPAIEWTGGSLSYAELGPLLLRTGRHLRDLGIAPGDVVGVANGDNVHHFIALLSIATIGAVIMPMDVRWTEAEKAALAESFGAKLVLVDDGAAAIAGLRTVAVDAAWHAAVAAAPLDPAVFMRRREQPLVLSLSSGTTGRPKGPLITHGHLLHRLYIYAGSLGMQDNERYLVATPLYFGAGRYLTWHYLSVGGTVVLYPPPHTAEGLAEAIDSRNINALFLVPTLLRRLLDLPDTGALRFPRLRRLISSGSVLHADERREISRRLCPNFMNFYSSTEGGGVSVLRPEDPDEVSGSIGRVVLGAEVQVVDETHQPVATGEVGRIRYRGGAVADGFYRDPEASKEAFHDGWYYPGDLARFDDKGYLFLAGRVKDMIIRGGVNIYPHEIEAVLMSHPDIHEAVVVGWPSRRLGEDVAAFVVPHRPVAEADLLDWCRGRLAPYKIPKGIFPVDDLPRNAGGKVQKTKLAERLEPLA